MLDLGAGDGRLSAELAATELTLADVSEVALARAAARLPEAATVALEPDAPLPLDDSAFDLVLCAETLEHVRDVQLLLSEARRVLVPGGTLAVTTPAHGRRTGLAVAALGFERAFDPLSPHLRFFTARSLARAAGRDGLRPGAGPHAGRDPAGARDPVESTVHADRGHRGRRLHRLPPERAAAGRRSRGARPGLVHPLLRARAQGGQPGRGAAALPASACSRTPPPRPRAWPRAFAGADAVCHLAGRPGVRGGAPHAFEEANVRTTESVLQRRIGARACGA